MKNPIVILSVVAGILLIGIAVIYFALPASHLPHFMPGYNSMLARHHFTHGVACLFLGLGAFAFGWFAGGKKSS